MSALIPPIADDLLELFSQLADGGLTDAEAERLRRRLADDPAAFDAYCRWMNLHALLYLDLHDPGEGMTTPPLTPAGLMRPWTPARRTRTRRRAWVAGMVGLAAALLLSPALLAPGPSERGRSDAPRANWSEPERLAEFNRTDGAAIAILSRLADATVSGSQPMVVGSPLRPGPVVVASGLVQLEFLTGVNLVVEGPAELDMVSGKLLICRRGKVRAHVPEQARGFTVETPTCRAVDRGTEFGVAVAADGTSEIHVLAGQVDVFELSGVNRPVRKLRQGDGWRGTASGNVEAVAADADRFVGVEGLLDRLAQGSRSRFAAWREQITAWRSNADVLAYYSFENHEPWARVLRHDAGLALPSLDGAIVGCRWAEGRWPGKTALEFKGTEDRVRLDIPGEYASASLACWIRIEGFDRWLSSILLTDGHDVGEMHWQFTQTGQLLLGVKADPDQSQEYLSETVLRPTDLGRWIHLACIYNADDGEVVHYVDGRRVSTHPIVKNVPLRFGPAELGNWIPENLRDHRIRSLNGRIDEFLLLRTSLSDREVLALFDAGNPHSMRALAAAPVGR